MLIAHVRFPIAPRSRQAAVEAFMADMEGVRAMKGCIAFYPFFDLVDDAMFGVVHEWECETDFNAYTSSDYFRTFGQRVRPLMTGKPVSRRFHAQIQEVIN